MAQMLEIFEGDVRLFDVVEAAWSAVTVGFHDTATAPAFRLTHICPIQRHWRERPCEHIVKSRLRVSAETSVAMSPATEDGDVDAMPAQETRPHP